MILFLFSGCNEGANNSELTPPNISINPVLSAIPSATFEAANYEQLNIINISYIADNSLKYKSVGDWQSYIQDKFDVELYINYRAMCAEDLLNKTRVIEDIIYLNFPRGSVSAWNSDVYDYGNAAIAYELSQYYEKYGWSEYIDSEYIEALSANGGIYAVPAINNKYIVPRYYNSMYLDALNMEIPTDIGGFYNYLKAAKTLKEDDGQFYPMCVPEYGLTQSLSDIFRAYDVYTNSIWNTTISYNPNTASFEDAVYSENMETALGFVRKLQEENLMLIYGTSRYMNEEFQSMDGFEIDSKKFSKELATEFAYVFDTKHNGFKPFAVSEVTYEYENGYYLAYTNSKNICEVRSDLAFYVFPIAIENIGGTVELFNSIFTNTDFYADLKFGIEDNDYFVIDGVLITIKPETGSLVDLKLIRPVDDTISSYSPKSSKIIGELSDEIKFDKNVFNQIFTYLDIRKYTFTNDANVDILFFKNVSPYDAITEYKKEFNKSDKLIAINELNGKIGAVTYYNYGD